MARPAPVETQDALQVVFLPPHTWDGPSDARAALRGTPTNSVLYHLAQLGMQWEVIPPSTRWWNFGGRTNPFLRALDPIRALRILLRHRHADVIVSVFESSGLFLLLLRPLLRFRPQVVLWDASTGNPWRVLRWIQRFVMPRYDGFMMLTGVQAEHLQRHYRLRGPVKVIGYNVDDRFFQPVAGAPSEYILCVGDDVSRDYATLMAAAALLPWTLFRCKTRWRPPADAPAPANVTFVSEYLARDQFRALYENALIVVLSLHPVQHAGGITALFEAMAMGKPLVVTDTPMARDFVTDGVHGLTAPPADVVALAAALQRILADTRLQQTLGAAARRRIEQELSAMHLAQRMTAFLQSQRQHRSPVRNAG